LLYVHYALRWRRASAVRWLFYGSHHECAVCGGVFRILRVFEAAHPPLARRHCGADASCWRGHDTNGRRRCRLLRRSAEHAFRCGQDQTTDAERHETHVFGNDERIALRTPRRGLARLHAWYWTTCVVQLDVSCYCLVYVRASETAIQIPCAFLHSQVQRRCKDNIALDLGYGISELDLEIVVTDGLGSGAHLL